MLTPILLALFLPCAGMMAVFMVYMCLLWYAASHAPPEPEKPVVNQGLSPADLDKLPRVTGNQLILGNECAICLEEIEVDQPVRMVPSCNHGFHLQCADTWLSKQSVCPICRTKLDPEFFHSSEINNPC